MNGGWQEYITLYNGVDRFEIRGNLLMNGLDLPNGGEGIDLKEGVSNGKIYRNEIRNLYRISMYIDAAGKRPSADYGGVPPVIRNIEIFQNYIHDNVESSGIAMVSEGKGSLDGIKVYNNIVHTTSSGGILVYRHFQEAPEAVIKNITIINNTLWNNGLAGQARNLHCGNNTLDRNSLLNAAL